MRETHLERHHCQHHNTHVYHRKSVFASEQARVEEPDTRNHEPDEGHGSQYPGNVAHVVDGNVPVSISVNQVPSYKEGDNEYIVPDNEEQRAHKDLCRLR